MSTNNENLKVADTLILIKALEELIHLKISPKTNELMKRLDQATAFDSQLTQDVEHHHTELLASLPARYLESKEQYLHKRYQITLLIETHKHMLPAELKQFTDVSVNTIVNIFEGVQTLTKQLTAILLYLSLHKVQMELFPKPAADGHAKVVKLFNATAPFTG